MFCTPSSGGHMRRTSTPTRPQRQSHHHHRSPSHESRLVPSPTFVILHSPYKSALTSTPHLSSLANGSASDSDAYSDEDEENRPPTNEGVLRSPTTPAGRKHAKPSTVDFSVPRHPRSVRPRISTTPITARPVPAACFTSTPKDLNMDWRTFGGDECMTRLSLQDLKDSEDNSSRIARGKERKRTENSGPYNAARHRRTMTPPSSLGYSFASSYSTDPLFLSQRSPLSSRSRRNTKLTSPDALPPLMLDSANILSPTSKFATPSNSIFAAQLPVEPLDLSSRPSSPIASISASTSTASSNFSFDDVKPLQDAFKPGRITRKFRPRDSGIGGFGTDESDGSFIGDVSFGSSSSLGNVEEDPLVMEREYGNTDENGNLPLATPSFTNDNAGWPVDTFWTTGPSNGNNHFVDSDQLLLHMAKAANGGGDAAANAKPVMPDTPMKKHPARMRAWQSTGKSWGLGSASSSGTLKAVPRKSLPVRIPDFQQSSPGSEESDPSPSKVPTVSRSVLADRRRSYGGVGLGLPEPPIIPALPISASDSPVGNVLFGSASPAPFSNATVPLFGRAELLRRTSSGAFSSNSEHSSEGTPTKRHSIPLVWKTPNPLRLETSESPESNLDDSPSQGSASPLPPLTSLFDGASSPAQSTPVRPSLGAPRKSAPHVLGTPSTSKQLPLQLTISHSSPSPSPSALPRPSATLPQSRVNTLKHARPSLPASITTPSHPARSLLKRESVPIARSKSPGLIPSNPAVARLKGTATGVSHLHSPSAAKSGVANAASRLARRSVGGELGLLVPGKSKSLARTRTRSDVGTRMKLGELELTLERRRRMELTNVSIDEKPGYFEEHFAGTGVLGKGTFGKVFKVRVKNGLEEKDSDLKYAVKVSKPYEGDRHRARLLEEVDVLRHLQTRASSSAGDASAYDNVLHYVDSWEQDRTLYIQTELCELGNLSEFLFEYGRQFDRLDEPRLWKILSELARGIGHIHRSGVIHLDLKPANVFVTGEGRLRIGDFGMASRWPRTGSDAGSTIAGSGFEREGDREYLAAEILQGRYGPEADVFSFGMMMLEAAGNIVVPSNGDPWHRLRNEDFSEVTLTGLSPTIVTLITSMMATDPSRRPTIEAILNHPSVARTLTIMTRNREAAGDKLFRASAFVSEPPNFLETVLGNETLNSMNHKTSDDAMDLS